MVIRRGKVVALQEAEDLPDNWGLKLEPIQVLVSLPGVGMGMGWGRSHSFPRWSGMC